MEIKEIRYFEPGNPKNQAIERIDHLGCLEIARQIIFQAEVMHRAEFEYLTTTIEEVEK